MERASFSLRIRTLVHTRVSDRNSQTKKPVSALRINGFFISEETEAPNLCPAFSGIISSGPDDIVYGLTGTAAGCTGTTGTRVFWYGVFGVWSEFEFGLPRGTGCIIVVDRGLSVAVLFPLKSGR